MEIVHGVYQMKLPLPGGPLDHVNAYLIDGSQGNLLIDTGWNTPEAFSALGEDLKSNGFDFSDITQIVITHLHPDHYGLAGRIKELSGATLALSEIDARLLDRRYVNMSILLEEVSHLLRANGTPQSELSQLSQASMPARQFVVPAKPDRKLKAGQKVSMDPFEFKVLLTPGHSPGHICLYEPERKFLFTGDHILPDITPNVGLHPQSGANALGDYIDSLKSLMDLEVSFVFPGHGSVFSGLRQRIDVLLGHHQQRMTDMLNVIRDDPKTAYQIATEIPWVPDEGGINFQDLPPLDRRLAVLETLAHIQLLATEGKVNEVVRNRISLYRATSRR